MNGKGQLLSAGDDCVIKLWDVNSPTWVPQTDNYHSDSEEEENEALDILRDMEEDDEEGEEEDRGRSKSRRKPLTKSSAPNKSSKRGKMSMDVDEDVEEGEERTRRGAAAYKKASVLRNNGKPIQTWLNKTPYTSLSHKWSPGSAPSVENANSGRTTNSSTLVSGSTFATSALDAVYVWDYERSEPVSALTWSETMPDSFLTCAFNPVEYDVLAATAADRSMAFFDLRAKSAVRKMTMKRNCNALAWNPMEAFNFTVASEDHNLYTFDMRNLSIALNVHSDHVGAVLDVDYSPTGREFVSGSYDKTIRIFPVDRGQSREVYHTKRMQRVFCVRYSLDTSYVLSASDDTNIRVWKSNAHSLEGIAAPRQRQKMYYQAQLVERYKHLPEISRIHKKRHLPKDVLSIGRTKKIMKGSATRKAENMRAHSADGAMPRVPERRKNVLREEQ